VHTLPPKSRQTEELPLPRNWLLVDVAGACRSSLVQPVRPCLLGAFAACAAASVSAHCALRLRA
jgi:hypothetical protein